ncbi:MULTISPECIES: TIGR02757 family protein [unclassified Campylobacter]|uniref:TIGR02757 family protein n=1 Tax=unclassified Campylobacter TaxID=2593542 RepID=UPI001237C72A|nr:MULTISPECIES: TIGR02757 family protein [unclassified Campylobacter]KAA6227146.1 TIGR02757 family protein [Campylobacter sp. LR185c]KAA6227457.1 TIGR02757 family protein [Campylobacter sp. LR196d]KAA6228484.1 TIGR02757 family protein [Campylobacter sp. LR286c]KAA6230874.1 TIGR02757 family protein [Campylobacter sp. LR291e]KAA6233509.1 TIGR02757 family protein [Campylobacter sp. LR264d]
MSLKARLDNLALKHNTNLGLFTASDPLQIAKNNKDECAILLCALFAYGNANQILKFLKKLDFSLLNESEKIIKKDIKNLKYRFQNEVDIQEIFISLRRFKQEYNLKEFFFEHYKKEFKVQVAFREFIRKIYALNSYKSQGFSFFFSKVFENEPTSTLKRYNLFLRWLVRKDELDIGIWADKFSTKDLLIPLDTHTHKVALKNKLLQRKSYDFKAVLELTNKLKEFDKNDPIKYDFALYRLGQSGDNLLI